AAIRSVHHDLLEGGISSDYADALAAYASSNLVRKLRRSTRGAGINLHGKQNGTEQNRIDAKDVFSDQSKVAFQHDYIEVGFGNGPGTWLSVAESGLNALRKIMIESP